MFAVCFFFQERHFSFQECDSLWKRLLCHYGDDGGGPCFNPSHSWFLPGYLAASILHYSRCLSVFTTEKRAARRRLSYSCKMSSDWLTVAIEDEVMSFDWLTVVIDSVLNQPR